MADRKNDAVSMEMVTVDCDNDVILVRIELKDDVIIIGMTDVEEGDYVETELSKKEAHVLIAILGNMAQMMPNLRREGEPTPADVLKELESMKIEPESEE